MIGSQEGNYTLDIGINGAGSVINVSNKIIDKNLFRGGYFCKLQNDARISKLKITSYNGHVG